MKVVLYSALYGNYEAPKPLSDLGVPAIMYTDNPNLEASGWEVRYRPAIGGGRLPIMKAKWFKCHPHLATDCAEVSLWVDASMTIMVDDYIQRCLDVLGDDDWVMTKHPGRDCIYDEANVSMMMTPKYNVADIQAQVEAYRQFGHPAHWGLFANGANVRRHSEATLKLCEQWWWECTRRSWQDQISLPVLVRFADDYLKWNTNMPWHEWWHVGWH